jgi:hypothetical protein
LEGTFRRLGVPTASAEDFAAAGYTVEVLALGVAERISWAGCVARYLNALENRDPEDVPRWAPREIHDTAFRAMPGVTQALADHPAVARTYVGGRPGSIVYDSAARGNDYADAAAAVAFLRANPTPEDIEGFRRDLNRIRRQAARLPLAEAVAEGVAHLEELAETAA